jgi:hypothetical protein
VVSRDVSRLVLELALTCLQGAALGRALMILQEETNQAEEAAAEALAAVPDPALAVDLAAADAAAEAAAALAEAQRAELTAATRWAAHVAESRELARRAFGIVDPPSGTWLRGV